MRCLKVCLCYACPVCKHGAGKHPVLLPKVLWLGAFVIALEFAQYNWILPHGSDTYDCTVLVGLNPAQDWLADHRAMCRTRIPRSTAPGSSSMRASRQSRCGPRRPVLTALRASACRQPSSSSCARASTSCSATPPTRTLSTPQETQVWPCPCYLIGFWRGQTLQAEEHEILMHSPWPAGLTLCNWQVLHGFKMDAVFC